MHMYIQSYIHACNLAGVPGILAYIHQPSHQLSQLGIRTHTYIHTYITTYILTYIQLACIHTHADTYAYTHTDIHTHACMHT